jgi:hypothetical protein
VRKPEFGPKAIPTFSFSHSDPDKAGLRQAKEPVPVDAYRLAT